MKIKVVILIFFSLLVVITKANNDSLKIRLKKSEGLDKLKTLQTLTRGYMFQSLDSCEKYGTWTADLASRLDQTAEEADAYKKIGYANYSKGNYEKSLEYFFRSEQLFFDAGEYLDGSVITNFIGDTYMQMGDYDKAIDNFQRAEKSCDTLILNPDEETSAKRLSAILFTNIGLLYYNLDSVQKPLDYFNKALGFAHQINDSIRITASLSNIGMVYKAQKEYTEAMQNYLRALSMAKGINHLRYQTAILNNIANIHLDTGNSDSALFYYQKAKNIIKNSRDKYGLSLVNENIGGILTTLGKYREALPYLQEALSIAKTINARKRIYRTLEKLAEVNEKMGNPQKALHYYQEYTIMKDSVMGENTRTKIAELEIKYETEKKEKENLALKNENEIQSLQTLRQMWIIIGLAVLAFFFILTILLYRTRYFAFKNLVQKNIRIINIEKELSSTRQMLEKLREKKTPPDQDENEQLKEIMNRLDNFMKTEKPYFVSHITIDEISRQMGTNRTYLANAIKQESGHSFNSFINEYRIKEAMQLLSSPDYDNYSIEGIGQQVGFSNRISFNSNFKKITGVSPSVFREKR